ncbi:MAG: 6-carboxytetrahydropterin synthase [Gemmatimonadales bacterium]|jgi:6-pyruvoyltetrahydropterin/6-carboxytetrahydropterin synthase
MVFRAAVRASYDAALYIPNDEGPAGRIHGHGYTVEAVLESDGLGGSGFVADFDKVQPLLAGVAGDLDHRLLNDLEPFAGGVPSAERQAEYFYHRLSGELKREYGESVRVVKIRVVQEPEAWAEYEP